MMFIFFILLIVLIIYLVRDSGPPLSMFPNNRRSALDIVRERYARGEIDEVEFLQRKEELLK